MDYIKEKLFRQLAVDYCCSVSDIKDNKNHFTKYKTLEGRRQFEKVDDCVLKVIAVNGKLIFTGKKPIVYVCRQKFSNMISFKKVLCHIMEQVFQILHHNTSLQKQDLKSRGWN